MLPLQGKKISQTDTSLLTKIQQRESKETLQSET